MQTSGVQAPPVGRRQPVAPEGETHRPAVYGTPWPWESGTHCAGTMSLQESAAVGEEDPVPAA